MWIAIPYFLQCRYFLFYLSHLLLQFLSYSLNFPTRELNFTDLADDQNTSRQPQKHCRFIVYPVRPDAVTDCGQYTCSRNEIKPPLDDTLISFLVFDHS